jgi:hypothetical protein
MKGGKGGTGRKKTVAKSAPKPKHAHDGPKRGAPKKDWGAAPVDDLTPRKAPRQP